MTKILFNFLFKRFSVTQIGIGSCFIVPSFVQFFYLFFTSFYSHQTKTRNFFLATFNMHFIKDPALCLHAWLHIYSLSLGQKAAKDMTDDSIKYYVR